MKAILMTAAGKPDVLELQEVPQPIPTNKEILVRILAAGVNPIDTKLRQRGTFYPEQMPAILGCDGAGIVEAVGSDVEKFHVGDEVYFCYGGLGGNAGNYAEYTIVDERFVAFKPQSISFAQAAAAPLVLITAWEALYERGRLEPGEKVLIHHGEILQQCANLIDAGKLTIEVSQTFPLAEAAKAHAVIESGSVQGKLVLLN